MKEPAKKLEAKILNLRAILSDYWPSVGVTWSLTFLETALSAIIPLLIGFAIDGLLEKSYLAFSQLYVVFVALIILSVARRIYDTRAYGTIKVRLSEELLIRSNSLHTSKANARLEMGRELIDFLEQEVPELMSAFVQIIVAIVVLYAYHPALSYTAISTAVLSLAIYALFHRRFFNLNAQFNHEKEQQVHTLDSRKTHSISAYLKRLRLSEVKISDTESYVYGLIFFVMLSFISFNLWYSTTSIEITVGTIFSIISYSWEFVESSLVLPITLQSWSRLSEIIQRINAS